jgi:hypothetical protein
MAVICSEGPVPSPHYDAKKGGTHEYERLACGLFSSFGSLGEV